MSFFTYILQSDQDGSYYIGSSQDPDERLIKHNRNHAGYSSRKRPWRIVWKQEFSCREEAIKMELPIKKQKSKSYIESLISGSSAV